jgi:hypothetical protein
MAVGIQKAPAEYTGAINMEEMRTQKKRLTMKHLEDTMTDQYRIA